MSRKNVISRTYLNQTVRFLCLNEAEQKLEEKEITLSVRFKRPKAVLKYASDMFGASYRVIKILDRKVYKTTYEMDNEEFLANARLVSQVEQNEDEVNNTVGSQVC